MLTWISIEWRASHGTRGGESKIKGLKLKNNCSAPIKFSCPNNLWSQTWDVLKYDSCLPIYIWYTVKGIKIWYIK